MKYIYTCIFIIVLGCYRKVEISSPNRLYVVTVFDRNEIRYIVNGEVDKIPSKGFAAIDLKGMDPIADEVIFCCGDNPTKKWIFAMDEVKILQNSLDTNLYQIISNFDKILNDSMIKKQYFEGGCVNIDMNTLDVYPKDSVIIKIK